MIRAVVDTNILVRAVIKPRGSVGPILTYLASGLFVALYSDATIEEIVDVLGRPKIKGKYGVSPDDVEAVVALILLRGERIVPSTDVRACRDPDDDEVFNVAGSGRADVIVSGDDDLLTLDPFDGIPILGPSKLLQWLDQPTDG